MHWTHWRFIRDPRQVQCAPSLLDSKSSARKGVPVRLRALVLKLAPDLENGRLSVSEQEKQPPAEPTPQKPQQAPANPPAAPDPGKTLPPRKPFEFSEDPKNVIRGK